MNIRKLIDQLIAIQYAHGNDADVWIRDKKGDNWEISKLSATAWNRDEAVASDVYLEAEE